MDGTKQTNDIMAGYPKTFSKCPHCGSEKLSFAKNIVAKMNPPGTPTNPQVGMLPMQTQLQGPLTAYVLMAIVDVCVECGGVYAVYLNIQRGTYQLRPQTPGPGGQAGFKGYPKFPA